MKEKLRILMISLFVLLCFGFINSASALPSFSIDFGQDGSMDTELTLDWTGNTAPKSIMADLWVNDVEGGGVAGFGFSFGVMPGAEINFEIANVTIPSPWAPMINEIVPGGFNAEALLFPPGTFMDGSFKMASFEIICIKNSIDELYIMDLDDRVQWLLADGTVLDDIILPQKLATLTQTPVPGAVWLMASGLLGLVGLGRRKNN